jgi:geranylgeranyl pyrophosphate synthase
MAKALSMKRRMDSRLNLFEESLESLVHEAMSSSEAPAMVLARDVLLAGGKRLRPLLCILSYEAAGGEDVSEVMDLALSAELLHTATLVHDDIYDQSKVRRGRPTLHSSHGISHAIIAGDYLFSLGFSRGGRYDLEVVDLIATACANIATGELLQFDHIGDLSTTPEDYYSIIDGKTAGPFATGCACAALVAGASREIADLIYEFGAEFGRAFQLVDDLLDLIGDPSMGKPRGTDVHEGKMTLPLIHSLTTLHGTEREHLADVLNNFSDDRWNELHSLLEASDSLGYVRQLIQNHVDRALEILASLPPSPARELMSEVALVSKKRRI